MANYTLSHEISFDPNLSDSLKDDVVQTIQFFGNMFQWTPKKLEDFCPDNMGWAMARSIAYGKYHSALSNYKQYYDKPSENNEAQSDMHIAGMTEFISEISKSKNFQDFTKNVNRMIQAIQKAEGRYNVVWYAYMDEGTKAPWQ
jgi:predicted nucleotide-binding protein (sugar kinase/HSP70/actin superfamily)|nr:MAG TPA: hypothetical protein [Caudoviricetes sp.]